MHCLTGGQHPGAFAADTLRDRFVLSNAEPPQILDPGPRVAPWLPVATPEATTDSLVQFAEVAWDRHQAEVAHPAAEVPAQLLLPVGQRHAAIAAGDVPHPVLELAGILGADAKLAAVALEQEAEDLRPLLTAVRTAGVSSPSPRLSGQPYSRTTRHSSPRINT